MDKNISTCIYEKFCSVLSQMSEHPESVTDDDRNKLEKLYALLCKTLGVSETGHLKVEWRLEKWFDTARKLMGCEPDEILVSPQNIVLDNGANEILKLVTGTGGTKFDSTNSYIYVGTDSTPENASQTGVLATGSNRAFALMDTGYPVVNGRQMIFRASFGDTSANFAWNEASIVNGTGANAIAMNRKVSNMGTKASGTWTLHITVSLTSAT